jgi:hypothetical protein
MAQRDYVATPGFPEYVTFVGINTIFNRLAQGMQCFDIFNVDTKGLYIMKIQKHPTMDRLDLEHAIKEIINGKNELLVGLYKPIFPLVCAFLKTSGAFQLKPLSHIVITFKQSPVLLMVLPDEPTMDRPKPPKECLMAIDYSLVLADYCLWKQKRSLTDTVNRCEEAKCLNNL